MKHMVAMQKILRAVSLVGQLGFCIITPPLVFLWLSNLLETRCGFGVWVSVLAIVLGLLTAAGSVRSLILRVMRQEKKNDPPEPPVGFNRHS